MIDQFVNSHAGKNQRRGVFGEVWEVVKRVSMGRVTTYGALAETLRSKGVSVDARMVGWALHANKNPGVPCHRVVDKNGRLAPNYSFGGSEEQRVRLVLEGVGFIDEDHVDLKRCLWKPK